MFTSYSEKWSLQADSEIIVTPSSQLYPVRYRGQMAMLKIAPILKEKFGRLPMLWWNGQGAAKVYESDGDAILMERTDSRRNLFHMAMTGSDEMATRIICRTVAELHAPRPRSVPDLVPLDRWPIVAEGTGFAPRRILLWVLANGGLSAAWYLEDGDDFGVQSDLTMAEIAIAELDR